MRLYGKQGAEETPRATPHRLLPRLRLPLWCGPLFLVAVTAPARAQALLPDAPLPRSNLIARATEDANPNPASPAPQQTFPPESSRLGHPLPGLEPSYLPRPRPCSAQSCSQVVPAKICCQPGDEKNFATYLSHNSIHIYTPAELAALAWHGVADPFNLLTIAGTSLISVASDSHSPYGPGFHGWARLSGVALTQDLTGEFVGTFLIPSIDHQDPHFHRMPNASIMHRTLHCLYQPFWTVSDTGRPMPNYSTLVGSMMDEAVDVSYVPYQRTGWGPSAARIATGWATDPIGNLVTEFVPDVARHINVNIVFIQRIVNRVALEEMNANP